MSFTKKLNNEYPNKYNEEIKQLHEADETQKQSDITNNTDHITNNTDQKVSINLPSQKNAKVKKSYLTLYLPDKDKKKLKNLAKKQGYTKVSHFVQDIIKQLPDMN